MKCDFRSLLFDLCLNSDRSAHHNREIGMYPVVPTEVIWVAIQVVIYFIAGVAVFLGLAVTARV